MIIKDIITESNSLPIIVVDIQPAYSSMTSGGLNKLAHMINTNRNRTLMFVNADETGMTEDNIQHDIIPWWEDWGLNEDANVEWFDKGYGYLRGAMDQGVDDADIIKIIREMYQQKIFDSRELFGGDEEQIIEFVGEYVADIITTDAISVEWVSISKLKEYNKCLICGGGKDECLKEVLLLMNAFNIKYKIMSEFVY